MNIETVRELYAASKVIWTVHGFGRMQEKDIGIDDVGHCIMSGEIIENYPDDYPHPSCLIFGYAVNRDILHVVVGSNGETLFIVTAYYPNTDIFEDDLKTRKVRAK